MVTKGYQKGVYERVTKGIRGGTGVSRVGSDGYGRSRIRDLVQISYGVPEELQCNLPAALSKLSSRLMGDDRR